MIENRVEIMGRRLFERPVQLFLAARKKLQFSLPAKP